MALPRISTTKADPAVVVVPRLADDPEYAEAEALLSAFRDRQRRLEREQDRLRLRQHFGERAAKEDGPADQQLRFRLISLEAEAPISPAPVAAVDAPPPAIALGLEILSGKLTEPVRDFAAQIQEIERQIVALRAAIFAQTEVVDQIANDLTFKYAKQIQPAWNAMQLEMYRAAQELARSARRVRELRAAIVAAGIRSRSDVLAMPNVRAPLLLGDETDWNSEIAGWRRILESLGILR